MKYNESEPTPVPGSDEIDETTEVQIRQEQRGVMMYAVFDGEEQVSEEYGPLNDVDCVGFAKGYKKAKEKYDS